MMNEHCYEQFRPHLDKAVPDESLMVELEVEAAEFELTIGAIEARHASVRRLLACRSTQTHTMEMRDLQSEWLCDRFRLANPLTKRQRKTKRARYWKSLLVKAKIAKKDFAFI